jgi:hypothetical protein
VDNDTHKHSGFPWNSIELSTSRNQHEGTVAHQFVSSAAEQCEFPSFQVAIICLSLFLTVALAAPQFEHLIIPYEDEPPQPSKSAPAKTKFSSLDEPEVSVHAPVRPLRPQTLTHFVVAQIIVGTRYSYDADGNEEYLFVNLGTSLQVASPKKNEKKAAFISSPGTPLILSQRRRFF